MGEATTVEEEYHWDNIGFDRLFEISNGLRLFIDRGAVDSGEEVRAAVDDYIEGEDAFYWVCICRDFSIEKLGEVAVEGSVWAAEQVIC